MPRCASAHGRAISCRRTRGRSGLRIPCGPWPSGSSYDREQSAPAHGPRPPPNRPGALTLFDREEDDLRTPDDVLERNISDLRQHAAIGRVVAIVAHHEEMAGRNHVFRRVVVEAVFLQIE